MAVIGDLVANFSANTSGFTKPIAGARNSVSGFVSAIRGSVTGLMGAFAPLAAIVAPIAGMFALKSVVDGARESEQATKKFQAVLTATGGAAGITVDEMSELAGELQRTSNFEDDATVNAGAMLASFTNIRGDVFKGAVRSAADLSAVMGTDLQSSIKLVGKALDDPTRGMTALRRQGITFSAEQKQQIADLQKKGDLVGAQAVILKELESKFGGAAEAMADPFTQIQNQIGDIGENIGFALLPVLKEIVTVITDWAGPISSATNLFKQFGEDLAFMFRNFWDMIKLTGLNWSIMFLEFVPAAEGPLAEVAAALSGLWAGAQAGWDAFLANLLGGIQEIRNLFDAVIAGVTAAWAAITGGKASSAASAFAEAFTKTLANQKGADPARNPFSEFTEAFSKAREETLAKFAASGGLTEDLRKQRDALVDQVAANNPEIAKKPGADKPKAELDNFAKNAPAVIGKAINTDIAALTRGSKEQIESVIRDRREVVDLQKSQLDALERIESLERRQLDELEDANDINEVDI